MLASTSLTRKTGIGEPNLFAEESAIAPSLFTLGSPQGFTTQRLVKSPARQRHHAEQRQSGSRNVPGREIGGERNIRQHVDGEDGASQRDEAEAINDQHGNRVNQNLRRNLHRRIRRSESPG